MSNVSFLSSLLLTIIMLLLALSLNHIEIKSLVTAENQHYMDEEFLNYLHSSSS